MKVCKKLFKGIGIIRSKHGVLDNIPIRPMNKGGCIGYAEIFPEFKNKIKGLDCYSHVLISYTFKCLGFSRPVATPSLKDLKRGVSVVRNQFRADSIGFCKVRLIRRKGDVLRLGELDVLDGALLLDITPYGRKSKQKNPC